VILFGRTCFLGDGSKVYYSFSFSLRPKISQHLTVGILNGGCMLLSQNSSKPFLLPCFAAGNLEVVDQSSQSLFGH
jgi:hypothetical protein